MLTTYRLTELVQQSKFIFRGTIMKIKAATMASVPNTSNTVIVRIDQVIQAPQTLGDYTGKQITVQLQGSQQVTPGQRRIFFTKGWIYGESLAVIAVDHVSLDQLPRPQNQVARTVQRLADQELEARMKSADAVILGRVSEIRRAVVKQRRVSEHDPLWHDAIIPVESIEQGALSRKIVVVRFPMSTDIKWHTVPKFQVGQDGIWILKQTEQREVYTALHPLDFQPRAQLVRIRTLGKPKR